MSDCWQEYADFTESVSIYPEAGMGTGKARDYAVLGILNESGELAGKVKKLLRDGGSDVHSYKPKGVPFIEAALDELGDVVFYAMRCTVEHSFPIHGLWGVYHAETHDGCSQYDVSSIISQALKLGYRVGQYAFHPSGSDFSLLLVVDQLNTLAWIFGSTLEKVAEANVAKLSDRKERGVIKGDGDNR